MSLSTDMMPAAAGSCAASGVARVCVSNFVSENPGVGHTGPANFASLLIIRCVPHQGCSSARSRHPHAASRTLQHSTSRLARVQEHVVIKEAREAPKILFLRNKVIVPASRDENESLSASAARVIVGSRVARWEDDVELAVEDEHGQQQLVGLHQVGRWQGWQG